LRPLIALLLVLLWAQVSLAISLSRYRDHVKKARESIELLAETEEGQSESQRQRFVSANVQAARDALARTEIVEWNGTTFTTDNSWLDDELKQFEQLSESDARRAQIQNRILERLEALAERLEELDRPGVAHRPSKAQMKEHLGAILSRSEYARTSKEESALERLWRRFSQWLRNLFPKPKPANASGGNAVRFISVLAEIFVVLLALGFISYALTMLLPKVLRSRRSQKKSRPTARIVLGERLEPDQSAADILAEAEALARSGNLRGAIRKGYIALLVELGDRKIISLAQYKTNRDYLRAVREIERLYPKMEKLTNSFEQHWYGLAQASENDWMAFRAGFRDALQG
jgi:Domain of unknown function (DUF4129)